jgi:hypothetical protein
MTAFFIPELAPLGTSAEDLYAGIRRQAQEETGHRPQDCRIFRLSFRGGGADVEAEVGKAYPSRGQTVLAILDLGRHLPYVIHCGLPGGPPTRIVVDKPVYAVEEFTS